MEKLLVARRSIYDKKVNVVGYDLLFQEPSGGGAEDLIPDSLTVGYIADVFADEDMRKVVGDGLVFVYFSENMLESELPESIPKEQLVITLDSRYITIDTLVQASVKQFHADGYRICASGFDIDEEWDAIAEYVHIVRVNVASLDEAAIAEKIQRFADTGIKLLADDIKTHEVFDICKALQFHYFEGYFLSLPNLVSSQKVNTNRITTMRLLVSLDDPEISIDKVEELLSQDSRLSYRLLRVVNSAAYGLRRVVTSLREAIIFIGLHQIRSWANIIVVTSQDEKPTDLMITTMIRAKMCELMAEYIGAEDTRAFFTVGLFSTLDALLDKDMASLLEELTLSDELNEALLEYGGDLGAMLCNVIAYQHGNWQELLDSGIEMETWRTVYLESVNWATTSYNELSA